MNRRVVRRQVDPSNAAFSDNVPPLLQRLLLARGVSCDADYDTSLQRLLPPDLKGLDEAAALLADAVSGDRRVLIVGDFDADGATSTALALLVLRAMGARFVDFLVPNRFEYGYGLTPEIVAVGAEWQPDLIVTVDNGIASLDGVQAARERGIEVLITDHHLPGDALPNAAAIVNPNQPGCPFPCKSLAGVGVMFYLLSALRHSLRERGWFSERNIEPPRLADYLDLVALGTVADVVPLSRNNRVLVDQGLRRIRAGRARPGLLALLEIGGRVTANLAAADLGFVVGPRLNAAGRLEDMALGIRCLVSEDEDEVRELAARLDELNRERRGIERDMQRDAMRILEDIDLSESGLPHGICLYRESWHQGVVGIVASRIKERYHRPVIAFAGDGEGRLKGSARSIPGIHIRDVLDLLAKRHPQLLSRFGGHAMAAGLSLEREHFEAFAEAFDALLREQVDDELLTETLYSDGELHAGELNLETARMLRDGGPWGQQFSEPLFDGEFPVVNQRLVGERHLKLLLALDPEGRRCVDAIAFNVDTERWPDHRAQRLYLGYRLEVNEFRGNAQPQLRVEYLESLD